MKKSLRQISASIPAFIFFGLSKVIHAASNDGNSSGGGLINPLGKDASLTKLLLDILDVLVTFAIPIIVIFIMYAGFLYVTAQGDESKIKKAHSALTWAIVGGVIVVGAKTIFSVIQNTITNI